MLQREDRCQFQSDRKKKPNLLFQVGDLLQRREEDEIYIGDVDGGSPGQHRMQAKDLTQPRNVAERDGSLHRHKSEHISTERVCQQSITKLVCRATHKSSVTAATPHVVTTLNNTFKPYYLHNKEVG